MNPRDAALYIVLGALVCMAVIMSVTTAVVLSR
jgi:hypothetical protein